MSEEPTQPNHIPAEIVLTEPGIQHASFNNYSPGHTRKMTVEFPGHVTITGPRGYYPGCRAVSFYDGVEPEGLSEQDVAELLTACGGVEWPSAVEQVNTFFATHANLAFVDMSLQSDGHAISGMLTRQLDGKELQQFQEAATIMEATIADIRERDAKKEAEEESAQAKAEAERAELLALGKKAKDHNLLNRLKEQDEEIAKLKAELKALLKRAT